MNRSVFLSALLSVSALSGCQKPASAPPAVVIQSLPGPAGPTGATGTPGATGMPGFDGSKGDAGKPGEGTVIIVPPPAAPASAAGN